MRFLWHEKPDVIMTAGYESLAFWQAFLFSRLFQCRFVLWSGAIKRAIHVNQGIVGNLRKLIIKGADGHLSYGTDAQNLLLEYGVDPKKIFKAFNTVDMAEISRQVKSLIDLDHLLNRDEFIVLYVGQLIHRKGADQLIKALAELRNPAIHLQVIGDGEDKKQLEALVKSLGLEKNVSFLGYKQYEELYPYFASANVLAMPSYEDIWGLVINEALAAGLPVISSKFAGVTIDLVNESNGVVIDPMDLESVKTGIMSIYSRKEEFCLRRFAIMDEGNRVAGLDQYANAFIQAAFGGR